LFFCSFSEVRSRFLPPPHGLRARTGERLTRLARDGAAIIVGHGKLAGFALGFAAELHRAAGNSLAKGLGWLSLGLGCAELIAARPMTRALGMRGMETLVRLFGIREIAAGVLSLSVLSRCYPSRCRYPERLVASGPILTFASGFGSLSCEC
jgi:hypothetical protein